MPGYRADGKCNACGDAIGMQERFAPWGNASHAVFYPSVFDRRTANVTTTGGKLSQWRAAMHHFVAYVMGSAGQDWGDQTLPPISGPG